jgi:hypothetical protein
VAFNSGDFVAASAKAGVELMFTNAMAALNEGGAPPTLLAPAIGAGQVLTPGVYSAAAALAISGSLVLDAQGDPDAVFIFQIQSALSLTGTVSLLNETVATASNVFWAIGSSAVITTNSAMTGIVMSYQSITMATGATLNGAALARVAAVSLISNTISLDGQASDTLATCTGCTALYTLASGKCLLTASAQQVSLCNGPDVSVNFGCTALRAMLLVARQALRSVVTSMGVQMRFLSVQPTKILTICF